MNLNSLDYNQIIFISNVKKYKYKSYLYIYENIINIYIY